MRIDSSVVGSYLLFSSLLLMLFSHSALLMNIAYITVLLSMMLFACGDLVDLLIMKLGKHKSSLQA
jgi:IS4 transposase